MTNEPEALDADSLAQEIRRVDGNHDMGAGALAEALMPFIAAHIRRTAHDARAAIQSPLAEALEVIRPFAEFIAARDADLVERIINFICDDVLPSYDIDSNVGHHDLELHDAVQTFFGPEAIAALSAVPRTDGWREINISRAAESLAGMIVDWYGEAPLPNARITSDAIAQRLGRFAVHEIPSVKNDPICVNCASQQEGPVPRRCKCGMGVDQKCEELARHFLSDIDASKPEHITELAEIIQTSVEGFIVGAFGEGV